MIIMVKKGKFISKNDYLCSCGVILHNTCKSALKKHRETRKHKDKISGIIKEIPPIKTEIKKEIVTLTFD